jgi:hypothetical protein
VCRLWAILVQLRYIDGDAEQLNVLKQALREVPKSGEVWCEVSLMSHIWGWPCESQINLMTRHVLATVMRAGDRADGVWWPLVCRERAST